MLGRLEWNVLSSTSKRVVLEFSVAIAVTPSEQANVQAIRSACDRVGVNSLKRKQIKAIVYTSTRLSVPAMLRTTVCSTANTAITLMAVVDISLV